MPSAGPGAGQNAARSTAAAGHNPSLNAGFSQKPFFTLAGGRSANLYTLTNTCGTQVAITNFGGAVVSLKTHNRQGDLNEITLGYSQPVYYQSNPFMYGAILGRYAGRIAGYRFALQGQTYPLQKPSISDQTTLDGAAFGFGRVLWQARDVSTAAAPALQLNYTSHDGDGGFPGDLSAQVVFTLTADDQLQIDYSATADKATLVNLSNNIYFNLGGRKSGDVLQEELQINASRFLPMTDAMVPTGELKSVRSTPFDYSIEQPIINHLNDNDPQMLTGSGYDHYFVLGGSMADTAAGDVAAAALSNRANSKANSKAGSKAKSKAGSNAAATTSAATDSTAGAPTGSANDSTAGSSADTGDASTGLLTAAKLWDQDTGRALEVRTTAPTLHFYTGNQLEDPHSGLLLEPQGFPDAPHHPEFPSAVLRPGETYRVTTVYLFSTR